MTNPISKNTLDLRLDTLCILVGSREKKTGLSLSRKKKIHSLLGGIEMSISNLSAGDRKKYTLQLRRVRSILKRTNLTYWER
jgi:hypothetical protein